MQPDFSIENNYQNFIIAGIDEAGRGPLAGPVVAACVILDQKTTPAEINDSKKLSKLARKKIFLELKKKAKFGVGIIDAKTIDKINIFEATKLAMLQAYFDLREKYQIFPQVLLVDGNFAPFSTHDQITTVLPIIKGDQKSLSIAAASIIAKEVRDEIMTQIDREYPQFGFIKHMGYPTKFHLTKIQEYGICDYHRQSFEPVRNIINSQE